MRVQILIWFQTFLLFTKPHFRLLLLWKASLFRNFRLFQTFPHICSHTPDSHVQKWCDIYKSFFPLFSNHAEIFSVRRCRGMLDWTLDSGSKGSGFDSCQCLALFVLQQDTLFTLLLSAQVYKWAPGRMRKLFVAWCGMCVPLKWRLARMLPRELRRCTLSAGLILNPVTGVIIHCKALWVVSHTRKALYKNQLLLLLLLSLLKDTNLTNFPHCMDKACMSTMKMFVHIFINNSDKEPGDIQILME